MDDLLRPLAAIFVGKPLNIAAVGVLFLAVHRTVEWRRAGGRRRLRTVGIAWLLYAAWEWLVIATTPEADIRVDLLLIWPLLAIVSAWFSVKALRQAIAGGD